MGIMAMVVGLGVPALSSMSQSSNVNSGISGMAGVLEQARQYAVAQNTYVWVAIHPQSNGESVDVAVLASKNGTDPSPWGSYGDVPNATVDLIGKIQTLPMVKFAEAGTYTSVQIPSLPATSPQITTVDNSPASTALFNLKLRGQSVEFDRAIQFLPSGEARNAATPVNIIEFSLQPPHGTARNIAVIRVNGFTGNTMIYRP